jgi:enoyl-CoA hydratase/carnithine racemase
VRAAVLTGAGRAFSTGGNLKAMAAGSGIGPGPTPADTRDTYRRGVQRVVRALHGCEVPLVAAVNGHAVGLGLDIACLCDVRLVAEGARLAASFIKGGAGARRRRGVGAGARGGLPKAAELFLTGDPFDAAEAVRIGLAARAVAAEALMAEALDLAGRMAANPGAALR